MKMKDKQTEFILDHVRQKGGTGSGTIVVSLNHLHFISDNILIK
jgi:hypothetical protein